MDDKHMKEIQKNWEWYVHSARYEGYSPYCLMCKIETLAKPAADSHIDVLLVA